MKRVKQLDTIIFIHNSMFIDEEETPATVTATSALSVAGSHIVNENTIKTPYITLNSKSYSWVDETQRLALIALWGNSISFNITYTDNSTELVRFAREKSLNFTPIYEGADKYRAVIPLAKII
jgi:hypothetical protein